MPRTEQVLERGHPVPEVALTLHGFSSLRLRSQPPTSRPISSMDLDKPLSWPEFVRLEQHYRLPPARVVHGLLSGTAKS